MKVVYTLTARQDLRSIYEYIAYKLLAPGAARNTIKRIIESISTLESMPERNPLYKVEPWYSRGVRFIPVKNYLVLYMINAEIDNVFVFRIMYGARDISRQLDEDILV